jgi:HAAS domain-containing protein
VTTKADKLVDDYLKRLTDELHSLPRTRRRELVEEISEHIAEARAELDSEDEARIRTLLDQLGEPGDIAAEARDREGVKPRGRWLDVLALILLPLGGIVFPVAGWVVGVVLLWMSETWTVREKLIGTFVVPGGLALPAFLGTIGTSEGGCGQRVGGPVACTGGRSRVLEIGGIALVVVLLAASIVSTAFLARRRAMRLQV